MSNHAVIRSLSEGLKSMLEAHLQAYFNPVTVALSSPKEMGPLGTAPRVSLWLYRVTRSDHLNNLPPERPTPDTVARHPLPVDLHFLVTPIISDAGSRAELMGAILQSFNDHAIVRGHELGTPPPLGLQGVRLSLESLTLEELTQVWYALGESYQLSVSYLVQYVIVDSAHDPTKVKPVLRRHADYKQIVGVAGS
jgi:uncharacterized protein DUF4255